MRFAHSKTSPYKHKNSTKNLVPSSQTNYRLQSQKSYIHYNNAIYMGGMTSYKRNGNGLMLIDDGTSVISEYCFDTMTGHNIIFRENCLMSVLFLKNSMYEVVVRTGQKIIKLPFYERQHAPNGNGILIDYETMKIYHILFQSGRIIKKIVESNKKIIEKVMNNELHAIIDQKHEDALKFKIKQVNGIKMQREGKKITVGYTDFRQQLEGVALKLKINEECSDDFKVPLEMKCIERGLYSRGRLQNFGERYFSNGNLYIGQFEDDLFNGQGLLLYPHEQKWVFGVFEGEKLKKMININLGQNDIHKSHTIKSCLRQIHEYNTKNWMCNDIEILQWQSLQQRVGEASAAKVTDVVIQKQKMLREEQQRLIKIQDHFSNQSPSKNINRLMEEQMTKNRINAQRIIVNQYSSLKAKVLEIEPRTIENEEYWSSSINARYSPSKILTPAHANMKINTQTKKVQSKYQTVSTPTNAKRVSPMKLSSYSPAKKYNYQINI